MSKSMTLVIWLVFVALTATLFLSGERLLGSLGLQRGAVVLVLVVELLALMYFNRDAMPSISVPLWRSLTVLLFCCAAVLLGAFVALTLSVRLAAILGQKI